MREKQERLFASVYANDETAISAWCFRVDSERVGTAGPAGQTGPPYVGDLVDRWIGAGRGGRTPTRLPSADFESLFGLKAPPRTALHNAEQRLCYQFLGPVFHIA